MAFGDSVSDEMENELYSDLYEEEGQQNQELGFESLEDPEELDSEIDSELDDNYFDDDEDPFKDENDSDNDFNAFENAEDEEEENQDDNKQKDNILTIESNDDLVNAVLRAKGIEDPSKIKYEDDNGEIQEVDFYELDPQERLNILMSSDADINYGLTDEEIEAVNFLRENKTNFSEAVKYYKQQAVEEYLRSSVSDNFSVDGLSNEELFVLDLKAQYEELTDEEIQTELDTQLQNKDLFDKKINRIRQEYIQIEAEKIEEESNSELQAKEADYEQLTSKLVDSAVKTEDIGGLDLTEDDKNEVLDFLLNRDINGVSKFIKNLDNHNDLFKMAWFSLKGEEAFEMIHDYYKGQIEQVRKTTYQKALEEFNKNKKGSMIHVSKAKPGGITGGGSNGISSIDDLYN